MLLIIHPFYAPFCQAQFEDGVSKTADSLNVPIALYACDDFLSLPTTAIDSILDMASAISISCADSNLINTILSSKKAEAPLIGFNQRLSVQPSVHIDTDAYTAGKQAGNYIRNQFGKSGTFAIITPSLDHEASNECIRGFREQLGIAQNRWKQLNILICNSPNYIISTQFRRLSTLQPKPVWLVAGPCQDFLDSIRDDKDDSYFITMALEPESQQVADSIFNAVAIKDYYRMGEMVVESWIMLKSEQTTTARNLNCGVQILPAEEIAQLN